jgi:hypothetical protein
MSAPDLPSIQLACRSPPWQWQSLRLCHEYGRRSSPPERGSDGSARASLALGSGEPAAGRLCPSCETRIGGARPIEPPPAKRSVIRRNLVQPGSNVVCRRSSIARAIISRAIAQHEFRLYAECHQEYFQIRKIILFDFSRLAPVATFEREHQPFIRAARIWWALKINTGS